MARFPQAVPPAFEALEPRELLAGSPFAPVVWPVPAALAAPSPPAAAQASPPPPVASAALPPASAAIAPAADPGDYAGLLGLAPGGLPLAALLSAPPPGVATTDPVQGTGTLTLEVQRGVAASPAAAGQEAWVHAELSYLTRSLGPSTLTVTVSAPGATSLRWLWTGTSPSWGDQTPGSSATITRSPGAMMAGLELYPVYPEASSGSGYTLTVSARGEGTGPGGLAPVRDPGRPAASAAASAAVPLAAGGGQPYVNTAGPVTATLHVMRADLELAGVGEGQELTPGAFVPAEAHRDPTQDRPQGHLRLLGTGGATGSYTLTVPAGLEFWQGATQLVSGTYAGVVGGTDLTFDIRGTATSGSMRDRAAGLSFTPAPPPSPLPAAVTASDTAKATVFDVGFDVPDVLMFNQDDDDHNDIPDKDQSGPVLDPVTGQNAENDLAASTLYVYPADLDTGVATLADAGGRGDFWLAADKSGLVGGSWTLGAAPTPTASSIPGTLFIQALQASAAVGDLLPKLALTVQGRTAAATQPATAPIVDAVEWVTYAPATPPQGWTPNDAIAASPTGGLNPPNPGFRVFPDALSPTDPFAAPRELVTARATVKPAMPGVTVWFEGYDVDDPSSSAAPVDGNDANGQAIGQDNRGDGAWRYAGLVVGNSHPTLAPATTDAAGHAALPFEVSMRPGDNYRVGAARDSGELVYDLPQAVADGRMPVKGDTRLSEMLTVWRKLHVERDSMDAPPQGEYFGGVGGPPQPTQTDPEFGGDDVDPGNLGNASIALMQANYAAAYVEVADDLATLDTRDDAAFVHNINFTSPTDLGPGQAVRDVPSSNAFWAVQIFTAYEAFSALDHDADPEGALTGYTPNSRTTDGPCYVFHETSRDLIAHPFAPKPPDTRPWSASAAVLEGRTVLHESLHRFFGIHGSKPAADTGVMSDAENGRGATTDNELNPQQLDIIRRTDHPY